MILSGNFLKSSVENYNKSKNAVKIEKFDLSGSAIGTGLSTSFYLFVVVLAVIFFLMEVFLLYYAVMIAINCSTSKEEKIINLVLAIIFTTPYVLIKITFDSCAKGYLKSGFLSKSKSHT